MLLKIKKYLKKKLKFIEKKTFLFNGINSYFKIYI